MYTFCNPPFPSTTDAAPGISNRRNSASALSICGPPEVKLVLFFYIPPGTSRWPRLIIACSAGKIFLYAKSPMAPKKIRASEWEFLIANLLFTQRYLPAAFSKCPPKP